MEHTSDFQGAKLNASAEMKSLLTDVRELMARISDVKDVEVQRLLGKVRGAMDAAKETFADGAESVRRKAKVVAAGADDYVHESPWQAVGIAALVGALVAVLVTRRS
jgi:ElaB/YqjD/DUF883 family membrane-anchored ribosome-binding protein